jgi:hypothetical protein
MTKGRIHPKITQNSKKASMGLARNNHQKIYVYYPNAGELPLQDAGIGT